MFAMFTSCYKTIVCTLKLREFVKKLHYFRFFFRSLRTGQQRWSLRLWRIRVADVESHRATDQSQPFGNHEGH